MDEEAALVHALVLNARRTLPNILATIGGNNHTLTRDTHVSPLTLGGPHHTQRRRDALLLYGH